MKFGFLMLIIRCFLKPYLHFYFFAYVNVKVSGSALLPPRFLLLSFRSFNHGGRGRLKFIVKNLDNRNVISLSSIKDTQFIAVLMCVIFIFVGTLHLSRKLPCLQGVDRRTVLGSRCESGS